MALAAFIIFAFRITKDLKVLEEEILQLIMKHVIYKPSNEWEVLDFDVMTEENDQELQKG